MNLTHLFSLIITFVFLNCTSTDILRLDETKRVPKQASELQLFLEEPKNDYKAIALIEVSDQGWDLSFEQLKRELLSKAAQIGGDAIIVGTKSEEGGTTIIMPVGQTWMVTQFDKKKLVGKVIVFLKSEK